MGRYKGANITENRVFDEPRDPINSDYTVSLGVTVLEAVIDPERDKNLQQLINEILAELASISNAVTALQDKVSGK